MATDDQKSKEVLSNGEAIKYVDLLPSTPMPAVLLKGNKPPHLPGGEVSETPTQTLLAEHKRTWFNGLRVSEADVSRIKRRKNRQGKYYSDFTKKEHEQWAKHFAESTILCPVGEPVGFGLFVAPGKTLKAGTIIMLSGTISFDLTVTDIRSPHFNSRAATFWDPNTQQKVGLVDPGNAASTWDFINHGFALDEEEKYFRRTTAATSAKKSAIVNLGPQVRFYEGIAVSCLEVPRDIKAGEQLLFRYGDPTFYYENNGELKPNKQFCLFAEDGSLITKDEFSPRVTEFTINTPIGPSTINMMNWGVHILAENPELKGIYYERENKQGEKEIVTIGGKELLDSIQGKPSSKEILGSERFLPFSDLVKAYKQLTPDVLGKTLRNLANVDHIAPGTFQRKLAAILKVYPDLIDQPDPESGNNALHFVAIKGNARKIEVLLDAGAANNIPQAKPPHKMAMDLLPEDCKLSDKLSERLKPLPPSSVANTALPSSVPIVNPDHGAIAPGSAAAVGAGIAQIAAAATVATGPVTKTPAKKSASEAADYVLVDDLIPGWQRRNESIGRHK